MWVVTFVICKPYRTKGECPCQRIAFELDWREYKTNEISMIGIYL